MNINKNIVDQRIQKIISDNPSWFQDLKNDNEKKISKAFLLLGVASYLNLELEEALQCLTDGGNDVGIDAVYIGDTTDIDFTVIIFQSKYSRGENDSNFSENAIIKTIAALDLLFDARKKVTFNDKLKVKVAEIQSLTNDAFLIPQVKCIMLNNGLTWNSIAQEKIDGAKLPKDQVEFEHFNHDNIINFLQSNRSIKTSLNLHGESFIEQFNFKRVLVSKINVVELANLFETFGDRLLEQNIRKYLGLNKNRVNQDISKTLLSSQRDNFYFYNNGITMVCSKFLHNGFTSSDLNVKVEDLQIINGGQSCKTIQHTVTQNPTIDYSKSYVLVRLYELDKDDEQLITDITIATNSQNPVDLRDLRANDSIQKKMEIAISDLGYIYKRKKEISSQTGDTIASSVAAEAIFTIWREAPHVAKYKKDELFGKFYDKVFNDLNASQLILAVLIFRYCDNQRRKEPLILLHPHLPYSNYILSMMIGKMILSLNKIKLEQLTHKNIETIKLFFDTEKDNLYQKANTFLEAVLKKDDNDYPNLELRKFASIFRRGEIVAEVLKKITNDIL